MKSLKRLRDDIQTKIDALDPPKITVDVADYSDIESLKANGQRSWPLRRLPATKEGDGLEKE